MPEKQEKSQQPPPLSEEDQKLKDELEFLVDKAINETDIGLQRNALEHLAKEIKTSTSSMTSVPKPLKFLRPHYDKLKEKAKTIANENQATKC
jgi:26S proteasome regulatory subunit N1